MASQGVKLEDFASEHTFRASHNMMKFNTIERALHFST